MGIGKVKMWQWILIGAFAGLALAWSRVFFIDVTIDRLASGEAITQLEFEYLLGEHDFNGQRLRLINDVTLYTMKDGTYVVSFTLPRNHRHLTPRAIMDRPAEFKDGIPLVRGAFKAPRPYSPLNRELLLAGTHRDSRNPKSSTIQLPISQHRFADFDLKNLPKDQRDVRAFCEELKKRDPGFTYTVAWTATPAAMYAIYTGGGIVVIGILWPLLLNLILYGSIFPPRDENEVNLRKVRNVPSKAKTAATSLTSDDMDQLAKLEKELAEKLASGEIVPTGPSGPAEPAPVRKLEARPLEPTKAAQKTKEEHEFGLRRDDFYPVERKQKQ